MTDTTAQAIQAETSPATPTPAPAASAAPTASRRPPHPVLTQLGQWYPQLFGATVQPLKRGIFQDLLAAHGTALDKAGLKAALALHTRSTRYLSAVASGAPRQDLQGQEVEATAPEHVLHALLEVFRRKKPRAGETPEQQQARLERRIGQLLVDSGLSPEDLLARAPLKHAADQASVASALARQAEQDARAEAVQRAYAASGAASPAAFAQMYGMHPQAVQRQLARAQQLQQLQQLAQATQTADADKDTDAGADSDSASA